jgi:CMP-N-acetylneuraminic acid synthetase
MWNESRVLAVVPARGGSKGIPRKNLCLVDGVSLIGHAARLVKQLSWLDAAVLSTDDVEIAEEGRRHGLDVPFLRPAELSGDLATSNDMWRHAWLAAEHHYGRRFDVSILLQPTTPLRRPQDVERTLRVLLEGKHRSATTVSRVPAHFTPEKIMKIAGDVLRPYLSTDPGHALRQSIPAYYYRNGACYAVTRETLVDDREIVGEDCAAVVIDGFVINIDEPYELEMADCLLRVRAGQDPVQ